MRAFLKLLVFLFGFVLAAAPAFSGMGMSAGTGAHTHSDANTGGGTLAVSGTVSSTKSCASGYTRLGPNFCWLGGSSTATLTRDVCTTLTMPAADAKALIVLASVQVVSGNAVAIRNSNIAAYDAASCSGTAVTFSRFVYEEVAKVATVLLESQDQLIVPVASGLPKLIHSDDASNASFGFYRIVGYFD